MAWSRLSVSSARRVPFAPQLPTVIEAGVADFVADQWYGFVAPAATRPDIVGRMNSEINRLMTAREVVANLETEGAIAAPMTPDAFGAFIKAEISRWREVIRAAGITAGPG